MSAGGGVDCNCLDVVLFGCVYYADGYLASLVAIGDALDVAAAAIAFGSIAR